MRKLLDEKYIFYKMSNIKLKENNKLFSKAESSSSGSRERANGNNRNLGISGVQKGRDKCDDRQKGSIDTIKSIKQNNNNQSKSNTKHKSQQLTEMTCNCNFQDSPHVWCQHYYSGIHLHRQQMFFSNLLTSESYFNPYLVPNPFCRSLSETAVPYQQLSNVYFNSYENSNGGPGIKIKQTSSGTAANYERSWQYTTLGKALKKINGGKNPGVTFKLMSYNVLAQDLLLDHPELYRDIDKKVLNWEFRWTNIYRDIKEHNCEILCFQEVQQTHLDKYYNTLGELGYRGIYKQRTGSKSDGCAIYYDTNKLILVEYVSVEYYKSNTSVLDRDNVGIIAIFAPKENPAAEFIVTTTHLLYNPRRHDVRLAQIQLLLTEIERMAFRYNASGSSYIPIILTGDLNTEPNSAIYSFIVNSSLKYENMVLRSNQKAGKVLIPPWLKITDNCQHAGLLKHRLSNGKLTRHEEEQLMAIHKNGKNSDPQKYSIFNSGTLTHNFVFKSAYKHIVNNDNESTTYQNNWITVDYIFYSGVYDKNQKFKDDKLKLLSRFTLPTSQQLKGVTLPNSRQGSDHLALLAHFKLEY